MTCLITTLLAGQIFVGNMLNPFLLNSIAFIESRHKTTAISNTGAFGILQITDGACQDADIECTDKNKLNIDLQIEVASRYIKRYMQTGRNICEVLYIYNNGYGNARKNPYKGDWQADKYVGSITAYLKLILKDTDKSLSVWKFKKVNNKYEIVYNK